VQFKDESTEAFGAIIMATGSSPTGYQLVESCLQHVLEKPVPSLFTLNCKSAVKEGGLLYQLSGVSVPSARIALGNNKKLVQDGPILITHHGISGPAVLRLSAFAAHYFHELSYKATVHVNWDTATFNDPQPEKCLDQLWPVTATNPKRTISSGCPIATSSIPKRLWRSLVEQAGIPNDAVWGAVSKKLVRNLAHQIVACPLEIDGKGTFKEEFVTAGGVNLKEIDMKTMESKLVPGLFFCGELINVDGVTGGYNFMNCWSTGFCAGNSAAQHVLS
jgi:predicted Rossmann fold flavoprotein